MTQSAVTLPVIDPQFAALFQLPPEAEWARLKAKIETEPYFDPLVVWQEENILLDGHTRLAICERFGLMDKVRVRYLSFPDRAAAWRWVVDNQLSRRNLTAPQKLVYLGMKYNAAKKERGGDRTSGRASSQAGNMKGKRTAERIAKEAKVSTRTVIRAGRIAEAVENLPAAERAKVMSGRAAPQLNKLEAEAGPRKVNGQEHESWRKVPLLDLVKVTAPVKRAIDAMEIVTCGDWAEAMDAGTVRGLRPTDIRDISDHIADLRAPAPEAKNGKQVGVNWPAFYSHFGAILRAVTDFHREAGTLNKPAHKAVKEKAGEFLDLFKSQVTEATGKPVPTH